MRTRKKGNKPLRIVENWSTEAFSVGKGTFMVEMLAVSSPEDS